MSVKLSPLFNDEQFINGIPASGAKVFCYAAGSSTKQNTYTDSTGTVAQANPIILNSRGEPANPIWLTVGQSYKFVFTASTDSDPPSSPIRTIDNVTGVNDASVTLDQWVVSGVTPTYVSATQFTLPGDQTTAFAVNRMVKATVTAGTVYGYISASVFGALTTVTIVGGALDAGLSAVQLGLITPDNTSAPILKDSDFKVSGSADKTKRVALEVDGLTTATTRTLTVQDKDQTINLGCLIGRTYYSVVTQTITVTIASPAVVTYAASDKLPLENSPIVFTTSGALPTGIVSGTTYYVKGASGTTSNISATPGGAAINTSGSQSGTHTANNPTYAKATNVPSFIEIEVLAAGGGGGGVSAVAGAAAGGGGAGGYGKRKVLASALAATETITVGAGGTAGANTGATGGTGGTTSFGTWVSCTGGIGGAGSTGASAAGGAGGVASSADFNTTGGLGGNSFATGAGFTGNGAPSMFGGNGLGKVATGTGAGGNAIPASGAGGGGALGASANIGGIGGSGLVIVSEYA